MLMNQEKGKEVVKNDRGKGGYSTEGLEQRVTYIIKIMYSQHKSSDLRIER